MRRNGASEWDMVFVFLYAICKCSCLNYSSPGNKAFISVINNTAFRTTCIVILKNISHVCMYNKSLRKLSTSVLLTRNRSRWFCVIKNPTLKVFIHMEASPIKTVVSHFKNTIEQGGIFIVPSGLGVCGLI